MASSSRFLLAMTFALTPTIALAAGGAFVVDDAEVGDPGKCTAQFWSSAATNHDFIAVVYPTCVVNLGKAVELGGLFQRSRASDVWGTSGTFTAKTNLIPVDKHAFGLGIEGGSSWDLISGASTGGYIFVPVTIPVNDAFKVNLNGGWLYDNVAKVNYATWGAGFEWAFVKDQWTLIGEVFGHAGSLPAVDPGDPPPPNSIVEPRSQLGLRFNPQKNIDIDAIWGHNITGENAQWGTLGLNVHF
ncbi:MAG: hypothetical protein ACREB2_14165 [Pseudolabrys sp.]